MGPVEPVFPGRTAASIAAGRIRPRWTPIWRPARSTSRYSLAAAPAGPPRDTLSSGWARLPQPTLTVTVDGTSVTFGGTADVGQIAGILVDGMSYAYRTQAGDTPQLVAANLAAMVAQQFDRPTVGQHADDCRCRRSPGTGGRGCTGTTGSSPPGARLSRHLLVPDTCDARRRGGRDRSVPEQPALPGAAGRDQRQADYAGTTVFDQSQNARLYRRDLTYNVEYATIVSSAQPAMLFGDLVLNAASITA